MKSSTCARLAVLLTATLLTGCLPPNLTASGLGRLFGAPAGTGATSVSTAATPYSPSVNVAPPGASTGTALANSGSSGSATTRMPTYSPSFPPGSSPSSTPTYTPSYQPSYLPSYAPSYLPSFAPSAAPIGDAADLDELAWWGDDEEDTGDDALANDEEPSDAGSAIDETPDTKTIGGYVYNEDGDPIEGATIVIASVLGTVTVIGTDTSTATGEWSVGNIPLEMIIDITASVEGGRTRRRRVGSSDVREVNFGAEGGVGDAEDPEGIDYPL